MNDSVESGANRSARVKHVVNYKDSLGVDIHFRSDGLAGDSVVSKSGNVQLGGFDFGSRLHLNGSGEHLSQFPSSSAQSQDN